MLGFKHTLFMKNTAESSSSDGRAFKKHKKRRSKKPPSSVQTVISNNDLLIEILLRLPVLSLLLFKSVSKRWLSLIKDTSFTFRRTQFTNLGSPCGMFLIFYKSYLPTPKIYEFVPFDIRVPACRSFLLEKTFTFGPPAACSNVEILQSCNGLLLCCTSSNKLYVYNPSISNMFKLIPEPDNVTIYHHSVIGGLRMAFDPTKSPHYKVIYAEIVHGVPFGIWIQIHTYSSETGNWSLCGDRFSDNSLLCFQDEVCWNDAIYWLNGKSNYFRLDIMNERPVLTTLRTPLTLDGKVHDECRLLESRGFLLLVGKDDARSRHFTIYEKGNVYSEWSVKYIVNLDDIINPVPKRWGVRETVFCVVLGEREEDAFLVLKLDRKVVRHKIMSKTLCTISNLESHDYLLDCFQFIPSFANV